MRLKKTIVQMKHVACHSSKFKPKKSNRFWSMVQLPIARTARGKAKCAVRIRAEDAVEKVAEGGLVVQMPAALATSGGLVGGAETQTRQVAS